MFGLTAKRKQEDVVSGVTAGVSDSSQTPNSLSAVQMSMGAVDVEVTPVSITPQADIVFKLSLNTHSVDLGYDYTQIATLTDDQGNSYKPSRWTGESGGHHLEGELIFPPLSNKPKELILKLDGIDNESEIFIWQL